MNWPLFASVFSLIFVAEIPDKTAFATLMMASRGRASAVFIGVAAAFFIQTVVAALFASVIKLAPPQWIHVGTGILFLAFAVFTFLDKNKENTADVVQTPASFLNSVWKSFMVIFVAEWGDLTQIATASLMAKYRDNPYTVFLASLLALWTVTLIAIVLGKQAAARVAPRHLKIISVLLFAGIGCYFLATGLSQF